MTAGARPMPVMVNLPERQGRPVRLVLVLDPEQPNPVRVWWNLDRSASRFRCSVHGPRRRATCEHMQAAYPALLELLLGTL